MISRHRFEKTESMQILMHSLETKSGCVYSARNKKFHSFSSTFLSLLVSDTVFCLEDLLVYVINPTISKSSVLYMVYVCLPVCMNTWVEARGGQECPDPSRPTLCSTRLTGAFNMALGIRIQVSYKGSYSLSHLTSSPPRKDLPSSCGKGREQMTDFQGAATSPCLSDNEQPSEDIPFLGSPPRVWEPGGTVVGNGCSTAPCWGDYRTPAWDSAPSSDLIFLFLFLIRLISIKHCRPQGPLLCAVDSRQWQRSPVRCTGVIWRSTRMTDGCRWWRQKEADSLRDIWGETAKELTPVFKCEFGKSKNKKIKNKRREQEGKTHGVLWDHCKPLGD